MVDLRVQPGVVAAIIFVVLDLVGIMLLEAALRVISHLFYYRRIFRARPVLIKSANIPGVTHYLLGKRFDIVNLSLSASKIFFLVVILIVDFNIRSRSTFVQTPRVRAATFVLNPSDEAWNRDVIYTVSRRWDNSKECVVQDGDTLTYYRIAFNLTNGVFIDNDLGVRGVNESGQYDIDDRTIVCLAPNRVKEPGFLARVTGCSRVRPRGCTDRVGESRSADFPIMEERPFTSSNLKHFNLTLFDPNDVAQTWPEYVNPRLTCLRVWVGSTLETARISTECLLVVRNGTHTIAERWNRAASGGRLYFFTRYPGPVFEGDLAFEEQQSTEIIRTIGINMGGLLTWRSLSAELVARSSEFIGNGTIELGKTETVTTIPLWTIILGGVTVSCVALTGLVLFVLNLRDERPKINTLNGLSSVLREEQTRTGNSLRRGEPASIGLAWADAHGSSVRLRVLTSQSECVPLEKAMDVE